VAQRNGVKLIYSYEFEKVTGINNTDYQYKIVLYIENTLTDKLSLSFDLDIGSASFGSDFTENNLVLMPKDVLTRSKSISFANQGANVANPNLKKIVVENLAEAEKARAEGENRLKQAAEAKQRLKDGTSAKRTGRQNSPKRTRGELCPHIVHLEYRCRTENRRRVCYYPSKQTKPTKLL
jgi:hypothetical protein